MTIHIILFQTNTFWISILGYFINKEPMLPVEIVGMVICFMAVVAITLSSNDASSSSEPTDGTAQDYRTLGYCLVMIGAWVFATTNVLNRVLKELHHALVMFYYSAFGMPLFLVIMLSQAYFSEH